MAGESFRRRGAEDTKPKTIDSVLVRLGQTLVEATFDRVLVQRGIHEPYLTEQFNIQYAAPNQKAKKERLVRLEQDTTSRAIWWNEHAHKMTYHTLSHDRMTLTVPSGFADEHQQALRRFIKADNIIPADLSCGLREDPSGRLFAFDRIDSEMPLHPIATAVVGLLTLDRRLSA